MNGNGRIPAGYYVLTFENTSQAIKFETLCHRAGVEGKLIPVPRRISSSCGLAARFDLSLRGAALALCREHAVGIEALYRFSAGKEIKKEDFYLEKPWE